MRMLDTDSEVRLVLEGICPWCGLGPFTVIAGHISKVHGIDKTELRHRMNMPKSAVIVPLGFHEETNARLAPYRGANGKKAAATETWKANLNFDGAPSNLRKFQRERLERAIERKERELARMRDNLKALEEGG